MTNQKRSTPTTANLFMVAEPSSLMTATVEIPQSLETVGAFLSGLAEQGGPPAMAATITVLDSVPLFPTPSISILAGALFGFQFGLAAVLLGQIGATAFCFLVGRYVLSDMRLFQNEDEDSTLAKVLDELTAGLNSNDFKTVFLTILVARQSPILPFSLGNYFIGTATTASLLPVLLATTVGVLPLDVVYVGAGASGSVVLEKMQEGGALAEGVEAVGALATFALVAYAARTIYKVVKEE